MTRIRTPATRHGLVLITVMVALALFAILSGVLVRIALTEQRQSRLEEWRAQTKWVVEGAIQRAVTQLAASAEYSGESWTVPAQPIGDGNTCVALIQIERSPVENQRLIRVTADFSRDGERVVRLSKEAVVELGTN